MHRMYMMELNYRDHASGLRPGSISVSEQGIATPFRHQQQHMMSRHDHGSLKPQNSELLLHVEGAEMEEEDPGSIHSPKGPTVWRRHGSSVEGLGEMRGHGLRRDASVSSHQSEMQVGQLWHHRSVDRTMLQSTLIEL